MRRTATGIKPDLYILCTAGTSLVACKTKRNHHHHHHLLPDHDHDDADDDNYWTAIRHVIIVVIIVLTLSVMRTAMAVITILLITSIIVGHRRHHHHRHHPVHEGLLSGFSQGAHEGGLCFRRVPYKDPEGALSYPTPLRYTML